MSAFFQDLRYGVRVLLKKPGLTLIALVTLTLGIGANTAIFSVVNGVLLRPLPLQNPDRLVTFWHSAPAKGITELSLNDGLVAFYRDRSHSFENIAAYDIATVTIIGQNDPEQLTGARVTFNYFDVLGQAPLYGRTFLSQEDAPGADNVIILSYGLWQRRFGGNPGILGQSIKVNNAPTIVIGIMPPGFDFPDPAERSDARDHVQLWTPAGLNPQNRNNWNYSAIGRLKAGLAPADAQRELTALWNDFSGENNVQMGAGVTAVVMPLHEKIVRETRTILLVLFGAVGLVLLITCANLANLLMAQTSARSREIAVRCSLGASSRRIIRQFLTEGLLLAIVGAVGGLFLAAWGIGAFKSLTSSNISRIEQVRLDPVALLFTLGVTILTSVLFSLAPAVLGSRCNLQELIKEGGRGTSSRLNQRLNNVFVVVQFALSLVLLIGAALVLQSFRNLLSVDPGFRPEKILTGRVSLPQNKYREESQQRNFYSQLLERVRNLPGVQSADLCQVTPFSGGGDGAPFTVENYQPPPGEQTRDAWRRSVTPGYFATMGIPILKGRSIENTDTETSPPVAVVDEKLARLYWPNEDPLGKHLRIGSGTSNRPWMAVVGVVPSVKNRNLNEDPKPYIYMPFTQWTRRTTSLVIRASNNPEGLIAAVRQQVLSLDPELPLFQVGSLERAVADSLVSKWLANLLLGGFAITALALAVIGIYGVMSLNVNSRSNEFGVRMALGAQPRDVLRLVVGQGIKLALMGVLLGLACAFAMSRLLKNLLFEVSPTDPVIFLGIVLILVSSALFACYLPARRATNVDPMIALR